MLLFPLFLSYENFCHSTTVGEDKGAGERRSFTNRGRHKVGLHMFIQVLLATFGPKPSTFVQEFSDASARYRQSLYGERAFLHSLLVVERVRELDASEKLQIAIERKSLNYSFAICMPHYCYRYLLIHLLKIQGKSACNARKTFTHLSLQRASSTLKYS